MFWLFTPFLKCFKFKSEKLLNLFRFKKTNKNVTLNKQNFKRKKSLTIFHYYGRKSILNLYNSRLMLKMWKKIRQYRHCLSDKYNRFFYLQNEMKKRQKSEGKHKLSFSKFKYKSANVKLVFTINFILQSEIEDNADQALLIKLDLIGNVFSCYEHALRKNLRVGYKIVFDIRNCNSYDLLFSKLFLLYSYNEIKKKLLENLRSKFLKKFAITNPNASNIKSDYSRGISFSERKYICDKDSNTFKFRDLSTNKLMKCSNYLPNFMCHVINRILRDKRRKKIHKKIAYKLRKNVRNRNLLERISILLGKIALANSKSPQLGGRAKGFSISNKQKRILKQLILLLLGKRSNEVCILLIKKLLKKYSLNYSQSLHLKKKYTKKGILKTVNEVKLEMHKALINEAVMTLMTITNHPEIVEEKNCPIFKQLLTCFKQIILKKLNKCKSVKCNLGENILYKNIHRNVREYFYRKLRQIINNKFQRNLNKIIRSRIQKFIMKNLLNSQKKKKNNLNKHCFKEKKKNETNLLKQSKKLLKLDKNDINHSVAYALFKKTKLLLSSWDRSLFKSKIPSSGMSNISYPTPGGYRTLKTNKLFFEIFICTCCKLALKTAMLQLAIEKPMSTSYVTEEINKKNLSPGCKNYLKAVFDRNNYTTDKFLKMKLKAVEELDLMRSKLVVQKVNESMSSEIENYEGSLLKNKMSIKKIKMIINLLLNRFYQKILIYGMKSYFIGKQDTLKNIFYEKLNSQQSLHKTNSQIQRKLIKRNERPKLIKAYNIQNNIIITDSLVNYFQKINYYKKKKKLFKDNKTKGFQYENDKMKYFEKIIYEITKNDEYQITPFAAKINLNIKTKFDMNVEKVIIPTNIDLIKGQITECVQNIVILEKKKWNEILNKQIKNNYKLKFIFQTILKEKQNQQLILTKSLSRLIANKLKYFYQKSRRRNITTCKSKINKTGKKTIAKEHEICNIWNYMVETYCEEVAMNEIYKLKYISKYLNLGLPKMDIDLKNLIQLAPVTGVVNLIMYKISFCIGVEIRDLLKGTLQDEKNLIRLNKLISISQTSNLIFTTKNLTTDGEYSFFDTYFDVKFNKVGVIMFRLKTDFIPDRFSVKKEICYLTFYINQKNSLVRIMGSFLLKVLLSAMNSSEINQWGFLRSDVSSCTSFKKVAYITFFFFCRFLNCISEDIGSDISITLIDTSDLSNFNPIMETEFITNQKLVNKFLMLLEKTVKFWLQQLSYVTCLANQVKFITHYEPPNTELEIDRFITSTSWNLKKFYKCRPCRIYINYLKQKKSDLYIEWLKLKLHFTEMVNRSTVCIEYLISLDKFWSPFHHGAFNKNSTYLPGILHCLIKFHLISQKNSKPHAVSNIIFKLSNRLIYNCINFLTDNFVNTVWEVSFYSILDRIKVCNNILLQYCCLMRRMDHKQKYFLQSSLYKEKFKSFMKKLLLIIYLRRQQFKCERFLSVNAMMFVELKRNLDILLNFMSSSVSEIIDPNFYLIKQMKTYNDLYNNIKEKLRRNVLDIVFATMNPYTLLKHIKRYSYIDIRCIHLPLIYKTADHLLSTQILQFMRKCCSDWKITKNFYRNNKIVKHIRYWKSYNNKMDRYAKIFMKFLPGFDGCACTNLRDIYLKSKKVLFIFERLYYRILAASLYKVKLFMHSTILNGGSNIRTGLYMLNGYLNVLPLVKLIRRFSNCHFRTSHTHNYWALIADDILRFWIRLILILKKFFLLRCISLETRNLLQPFLLNFVPYFLAFTTITWTDRRKYALLNNIEKFMLAVETFLLGVENYRKEALERAIEITEKVLFIFISTESVDYRNLLKQTSSDQKSILHFQSLLSLNAEHKVIELVNMIISKIKYNTINKEKIYDWYHQIKIKIEKMYSTGYHVTAKDYFRSKILFVNTKNYLKHCEVFFNYNYQRYMEGNYRAFFLAILLLRDRIEGYHYGSKRLPPLWKISFHMDGDNVIFLPSLSEILQSFKALFLLLLELSTKISLWGNFYISKSSPNKQNLYIEHNPSINLFLLQREVNPASEKRRMLQKFLQEKEDDRLKPKIIERPGGTGVLQFGIPTSLCLQQSLFSRCIRKKADNYPKLPLHLPLLDLSYKVLSENNKFQQNSNRKKFVRNIHKKNLIRIKKNCDSKLHRHRICKFLTKIWIKKILIWYRFVLHFFRKLIKMKKKVYIHILKLINDTVLPLKYNRYIQILQIGNGTKISVGKYNCKLLNNKFTQIKQRRKLRKILESIFLSWTINKQKSPALTLDKLNTLESLKECIRLTPNFKLKLMRRLKQILAQNRIKTSIFFRNYSNESKILKCKNECNAFKNYILRQEILKKNNFRFKNAIYDKKRDVYYKTMKRLKFISLFGSIRSYNNGKTCKQVARKKKLKSLLQNIIIREMKNCKNCIKKKNRNEDNWNNSTNNKTNYNKKLITEEKIWDINHRMQRHRIYKRKYRLRLLKKSIKKFYSIKWYKKWRKHRARNRNVKKLPHNIMEKINKYYLLFRPTLKLTDTSTQLLKDCLNVEAIIQENLIKDTCSKNVEDKENASLINFILKRKNPMQEFNYIKDATGIQIEKFEKYLAHLATKNKKDILKYCQRLWRVISIRPFPSICIKLWQCLGKHRRHRIDQNYFNESSFISIKIIDDMRKNMKIHKRSPYNFSKDILKNFIDIFNDYLGNDENKMEKQLSSTKIWNGFNGPTQNLRDKRNKTNTENHQSISKSIYHSLCTQSEVIELVVKMRHHIIRSQQLIKKKITDYFTSCFLTTFVNYLKHIPRYFGSKANINTASKAYDKWNMIKAFKLYSLTQIISYPFAIILDPINFIFVKLAVEWRFALNDWLVMHIRSRIKNILYYIINKIQILNIWIKHFNQIYQLKNVIQEILNDYIHLTNEISSLEKLYLLTVHHKIPLSWKHFTAGFSIRMHFVFLMKLKLHRQTNLELSWPYILYDFLSEFEDLMLEIKEFSKDYEDNGPSDPDLPPNTAIKKIIFYKSWYAHLIPRYNELMLMTPFFGFINTELPELEKYNQKFNYLEKLFGIYITVMSLLKTYNQTSWCNFDTSTAQTTIQEYQNRIRILPAPLKKFYMFRELKKSLDSFNEYCFVLELLSNPALEKKHWNRLEDILNAKLPYDSLDFKLMHLLETKLLEYRDDVEDVYTCAIKEGEIRKKLNQYVSTWSKTKLFFAAYKEHGEVIFKGLETADVLGNLEEDIMVLKSMSTSRYSTFFANELSFWVSNLSLSHSLLKEWLKTQNLWVYLEPVFLTGDVPQQMPKPAIVFSKSTKNWMLIMQQAHNYYITDLGKNKWLKSILEQILISLEQCLEALASYLESKRRRFPRFYFISDATLLEILELGSDITSIQNYLAGVFENIDTLRFHEEMFGLIICIVSREGEVIPLLSYIPSIGSLEIWLNKLLVVSKLSLAKCISLAIGFAKSPHFDYITMVERYPSQVGLIGLQYLWTRDSEASMRQLFKYSESMIDTNKLFLNILNVFIDMTTRDLSKYKRVRYETLITIQIHQRDIYNDMVISGVNNPWDFQWQMQERFYYVRKKENILVQITDVNFVYQNEFMGCTDRLVITPLTDRCYITLAQAIGLSLGGAPAGPAGTGKTETTKDMGKSLGKYVVVFNCSDQMDFRGLGRIFKGLAQSGSWGCFDEFNRIELPVLSVAAQQIAIVLYARKNRKSSFVFSDGDIVTLSRECGIFITMNPGYAGRQELPENLKINFRSVSMMVPDKHIIIRVKLASCGLKENIPLSRKFYVLYQLCVEQLSQQVHYDFGLRNILSVLRALGTQKRENVNESEESTLLRVLRDMNVSKLVDEDEPLFMTLIQDLFVGREVNIVIFSEIKKYIIKSCAPFLIIPHPAWVQKVLQLYDTSLVRHGIMIMGPTGSGKTQAIHVLLDAFTEKGISHSELRMNPKAITAPQMFGRLDVATNDWTDGIFSCLWRKTLKMPESQHLWIVLDGPVDAVWIENLNSVLDDNKTLTLANGDRIVMATNAKLVFEPDNVDNASPATVSRMGMVFISSSVLPWLIILNGWFLTREITEVQILRVYFNQIYNDGYDYVSKNLSCKMKTLEVMYIRQTINIIQGQIENMKKTEDVKDFSPMYLQRLFLFSLMWSLGALLEIEEKVKLETILVEHSSKLDWPNLIENDCGTIYDFVVNKKGEWEHWLTRVQEIHYPEDHVPDFANILVPNVDNVRTSFLIDIVSKLFKSVLLIGEQGTAKTVMIKSYLNSCDSDLYYNKSLNFSFATTPNIFQNYLEGYIEKRGGWKFGPPPGKRMILFIDDINMPVINEWGDQVTNEIVRQLMECGGVYSLDKPGEFIIVEDLQVIAAMIHPGGGRNDIPPRLKRQFSIFNCTLPSEQSMDKIFRFHCTGYFSRLRFNEDVVDFFPKLIGMTFEIWQRTKQKLLPTPANFHYIFNLRDLSRIWEGMMTIKGEECQNLETALKLWQHECLRVISDRLTSQKERDWFQNEIANVANEFLTSEDIKSYSQDESYFVDFLRDIPEATGDEPEDVALEAPKVYEELESWDQIKNKLDFFQEQYNESVRGAKMNLVFFQDAIVHIVKISRIIRTPKGAALLVGVGGSGKQSLTKIATFIANYQLHQIAISRSYNVSNFLDDIKYIYRIAGQECRGVSFLFTDNEMKNESFLEILSNVIAIGVITNLFTKQEIYEIIGDLPMKMRIMSPKAPINTETLLDFFFTQVKRNIHMVFCSSPANEDFRSRALKFPGLISACTIDWFFRWPIEALVAVATHSLSLFEMECEPKIKVAIIETMGDVHELISDYCMEYYNRFHRRVFVTPKSYLTFLEGYKSIYNTKYNVIEHLAKQMRIGLKKLDEAQRSTDILKKKIKETEKEIEAANEIATKIADKVSLIKKNLEEIESKIKLQSALLARFIRKIVLERRKAKSQAKKAEPALLQAIKALSKIDASDIATVRKLGKPPYLITVILDVVLILLKKRLGETKYEDEQEFIIATWSESLKVLSDSQFLNQLRNYKRNLITDEMIDLMKPYVTFKYYTFYNAKVVCGNIAGLLLWSLAMVDFFKAYSTILPLTKQIELKEAIMKNALAELLVQHKYLAEQQHKLELIKNEARIAYSAKLEVQQKADSIKSKVAAAGTLMQGLGDEQVRWTNQLQSFNLDKLRLVGDALLMAGFLTYAGTFNQEYRQMLQCKWCEIMTNAEIPYTENLNVVENLTTVANINKWNNLGLPTDEHSVQNAIIVTNAKRFPLLIDPQNQGYKWVKNMEKNSQLMITTLTHKYFRQYVEDCLSLGRPLIIEDVLEEIDPILDNLLEKNYVKIGLFQKVTLGDREVDVNSDFRLYMTTKLRNPSYTPEVYARSAVIDFTVTIKGLEEQLLGLVINHERHELETERKELFSMVNEMKTNLKEFEGLLLYKLSTAKGALVDDFSLLTVLNTTLIMAENVEKNLENAYEAQKKINRYCELFRQTAVRGSVLYFLTVQISLIHCMYQTSLVQFIERFYYSMESAQRSEYPIERSNFINEFLTYDIFAFISKGLYEEHKFLWLLLLSLKVSIERKFINQTEFLMFIKGGASLDINDVEPKKFEWINDVVWLNICELSKHQAFKNLLKSIKTIPLKWKEWLESDTPEEVPAPSFSFSSNVFERLLLIRSMCPERTISMSKKFIATSLGDKFIEPVLVSVDSIIEYSSNNVPIICLLSLGTDPTEDIEKLAERNKVKLSFISMGQGQEIQARKLVKQAIDKGNWMLLQNCHLGLDYMIELVSTLNEERLHNDFRIWLSTEPSEVFPVALLHMSLKFTLEPPQGIRTGLLRLYALMTTETLEFTNEEFYRPILFNISYLHTVCTERKKFGPIGWNIPYEFNVSDWSSSVLYLQKYASKEKSVNWVQLRYIIGDIMYGGRVTDEYDDRLLKTLCKYLFSDDILTGMFCFHEGYCTMNYLKKNYYIDALKQWPTSDPPEACGLGPTANITFLSNMSKKTLDTILLVEPKESSTSGSENREAIVLSIVSDMRSKLPNYYDPFLVKERLVIMGKLNSMNIFLRQEIDRMQRIIILVTETLVNLMLAIEGIIVLGESLRDAFDCIFDAKIPKIWKQDSWTSSTLGFWFSGLLDRNKQLSDWIFDRRPFVFWFGGFFNSQGFLTAMRQEVTRAHYGWSLETTALCNSVTNFFKEEIKSSPEEGVFVYGLFLEGAKWLKDIGLIEASPKEVYNPIPVINIFATLSSTDTQQAYTCPVYRRKERTGLNYITTLKLHCTKDVDYWIFRGVALLCDTT